MHLWHLSMKKDDKKKKNRDLNVNIFTYNH